jgi:two-component system sensor histidine kinase BaeS
MRLRIAHQLSLLLAAAVVLAVLLVGGLSFWNLRSGFVDYLRLRDEAQLTRFVQLVERRAASDPSMDWLRNKQEAMRELVDEFNGGRPHRRPPGPPDRPPPGLGQPHPPPPPDALDRPPPPPPRAAAGNLADRIVLRDSGGNWLAGRPQASDTRRSVRAVKVDGLDVAFVELSAEPEPEGLDASFLQHQYSDLVLAALGTIAAAVLLAWRVAGRWSRPLRRLQMATQRIAGGEQAVQIPVADAAGAVEFEQLIADVNAMAVALAAADESRRSWIAQISHELRTPLAVLRGEIESIVDGARQPSASVMASLGEEVSQLTRLVDDLHTLAVADLGQMPCHFVDGDANEALERMARRFETRAAQHGLTLMIEPSGRPITACWDFGRIEQLLSNLLENSLRYTTAPGRIEVAWQERGSALQLTVQDSLPGVAAQHLGQLFDPLFRVEAARTRNGQHGSGLGLAIVRAIAQAHRGHVEATASRLGGLAMRVELPLRPQQLERRRRST